MPTRTRAAFFPYMVLLCIVAVRVLLDAFGIFALLRQPVDPDNTTAHTFALYMTLGSDLGYLVVVAAFALAATQGCLERRRITGLPGYAPPTIAVLYGALSVSWSFAAAGIIGAAIRHVTGTAAMQTALSITALAGYVLQPLWVVVSVWLVFRLLRRQETPMPYPVQLRGRALLIFSLFAWAWVLALLGLSVPMGATLYAAQGIDPAVLFMASYTGSVMLILPSVLGALLALPPGMTATRPVRLWLASALSLVVSAIVMVIVTFAIARIARFSLDSLQPGMGFTVMAALVWFFLSVPLCWLVVKGLTGKRTMAASYVGEALPEERA